MPSQPARLCQYSLLLILGALCAVAAVETPPTSGPKVLQDLARIQAGLAKSPRDPHLLGRALADLVMLDWCGSAPLQHGPHAGPWLERADAMLARLRQARSATQAASFAEAFPEILLLLARYETVAALAELDRFPADREDPAWIACRAMARREFPLVEKARDPFSVLAYQIGQSNAFAGNSPSVTPQQGIDAGLFLAEVNFAVPLSASRMALAAAATDAVDLLGDRSLPEAEANALSRRLLAAAELKDPGEPFQARRKALLRHIGESSPLSGRLAGGLLLVLEELMARPPTADRLDDLPDQAAWIRDRLVWAGLLHASTTVKVRIDPLSTKAFREGLMITAAEHPLTLVLDFDYLGRAGAPLALERLRSAITQGAIKPGPALALLGRLAEKKKKSAEVKNLARELLAICTRKGGLDCAVYWTIRAKTLGLEEEVRTAAAEALRRDPWCRRLTLSFGKRLGWEGKTGVQGEGLATAEYCKLAPWCSQHDIQIAPASETGRGATAAGAARPPTAQASTLLAALVAARSQSESGKHDEALALLAPHLANPEPLPRAMAQVAAAEILERKGDLAEAERLLREANTAPFPPRPPGAPPLPMGPIVLPAQALSDFLKRHGRADDAEAVAAAEQIQFRNLQNAVPASILAIRRPDADVEAIFTEWLQGFGTTKSAWTSNRFAWIPCELAARATPAHIERILAIKPAIVDERLARFHYLLACGRFAQALEDAKPLAKGGMNGIWTWQIRAWHVVLCRLTGTRLPPRAAYEDKAPSSWKPLFTVLYTGLGWKETRNALAQAGSAMTPALTMLGADLLATGDAAGAQEVWTSVLESKQVPEASKQPARALAHWLESLSPAERAALPRNPSREADTTAPDMPGKKGDKKAPTPAPATDNEAAPTPAF